MNRTLGKFKIYFLVIHLIKVKRPKEENLLIIEIKKYTFKSLVSWVNLEQRYNFNCRIFKKAYDKKYLIILLRNFVVILQTTPNPMEQRIRRALLLRE